MDRDIALAIAGGLSNIKDTLTALATNTIPSTPNTAASLSMAPLMTGSLDPKASAPVEDSEVHREEIEEPEEIPEEPKSKK